MQTAMTLFRKVKLLIVARSVGIATASKLREVLVNSITLQ